MIDASTTASLGGTPKTSTSGGNRKTLDYDAFLKLLIEQLKAQDPSKPLDPSEYVAQLAQFSNVEQAVRSNQKLDSLLAQSSLSAATGAIGRTATSAAGDVSGRVAGVRLGDTQNVAVLEDGTELPLAPGVMLA